MLNATFRPEYGLHLGEIQVIIWGGDPYLFERVARSSYGARIGRLGAFLFRWTPKVKLWKVSQKYLSLRCF